MDKQHYENEGFRQLLNKNYYLEIKASSSVQTCKELNSIVLKLFGRGTITFRQYKLLIAEVPTKPRVFYLLPKIHKDISKWPHPSMPEGRPIVSDCGSETYHISKFIDYFLKPFSRLNIGYIKDSYHFIDKIKNYKIPNTAYLVTGDVTALYTNMNIDRSIAMVKELFDSHPNLCRPDTEILQLLEICLKTNEFEFAGKLFLQILGTAMGKAFAPNLANIYLSKFDVMANSHPDFNINLYSRFIDDIFFIWLSSLEELAEFQNYLNNIIPGIHITLQSNPQQIEFLDILIYTVPAKDEPNCKILNTHTFFKKTDTHQLLHFRSYHPKHTKTGILKSQFIRFKRLSSTLEDYNNSCKTLFNVLKHRGYNRSFFRKLKNKVWFHDYTLKRNKPKTQVWPIINYHDSISNKINRYCKDQFSRLKFSNNYRLVMAYKKHRNLGSFLTRGRHGGGGEPVSFSNKTLTLDQ